MNVIIDCDPAGYIATGLDVDDDLALIMALSLHHQKVINILGVTITSGNTQLQFSVENAYELIYQQLGYTEIPIYSGSGNHNDERWLWPITTTTSLFNSNNYDSYSYDNFYHPTNASQFIIDTIMDSSSTSTTATNTRAGPPAGNNDEEGNNNGNDDNDNGMNITILALGPLGNIASAYLQKPEIANHIKQIVMMGGILSSNPKHRLDYNFRYSPKSASIVLSMPCKKVMIPVETSIQFVFNQHHDLNTVLNECNNERYQKQKQQSETSSLSTTTTTINQRRHRRSPPLPVICTYQTRLMLQTNIMPYVVNWRYSNIYPQSNYFDNGFILWDVVALMAMINTNTTSSSSLAFFDNWIYYDYVVSKSDDLIEEDDDKKEEGFRHSTSGSANGNGRNGIVFQPTVLVADQNTSDKNQNRLDENNNNWWWRNRVVVPQTIKSEESMKEFIFEHLFLMENSSKETIITDDDAVVSSSSSSPSPSPTVVLTISSRLGLLPNIIILFCLVVVTIIVVFKKSVSIYNNKTNSRIIRMSSSPSEEEEEEETKKQQ